MTEERRLPDGEGVWFNDKGEWVAIARLRVSGDWQVTDDGGARTIAKVLDDALGPCCIRPGRWKLAEPPKFKEPKPPMVWAKPSTGHSPSWWTWCSKTGFFVSCLTCHGKRGRGALTVLPHPQNDPEAVRIIEEAQRD